jgi:hypothetical protein
LQGCFGKTASTVWLGKRNKSSDIPAIFANKLAKLQLHLNQIKFSTLPTQEIAHHVMYI